MSDYTVGNITFGDPDMECGNGRCHCKGNCGTGRFHVNYEPTAIVLDKTLPMYNALDRIKELEALAKTLVDALSNAYSDGYGNRTIGADEALAEAAKLGIVP